ncbi:MAG: adenylate/guanylate cyclase domain-containing protein [Actinobacteria bacterium]|nr:adenylate/guanylate cyclase domain-containing protein [Actinomycetota bacterium]
MNANTERAREVGKAAVKQARSNVRGSLRRRLADVLRADPDVLANAIELGLVRREWVDDPTGEPMSAASPVEVMQRFLEREVERRPSILSELGLSAIQILSSRGTESEDRGSERPVPLAVVFTDLEGFTRFTEREGDEAAHDLLQRHTVAVGPIVRSRGGTIVKRLGDGLLLTFPGPEAAVLAALELVQASPEPLPMRAGVHWGEAFESRDDVVGHDVNVAARVADVARGGEVLATVATRNAVQGLYGRVEFGRPGRRKVKGLDEPIQVCQVRRVGPPTLELEALRADRSEPVDAEAHSD